MEDKQTEQEVHDGLRIASYLISDDHKKINDEKQEEEKMFKRAQFFKSWRLPTETIDVMG